MVAHISASTFGLLGNIISGMVFLAPVPTFYRICRKKCTEGFQSFPYLVALFSATLWIYYAILKGINGSNLYLITINSIGCTVESVYIILFIIYAPKKIKISTIRSFLLMNVGALCCIVLPTLFLFEDDSKRLKVLGWVCAVFAVSVSAAPLSIMRLVVRTKSVEFMPFYLSLFLTLSAIMWFGYGLLIHDPFVEYPNVLGMLLGSAQMMLYAVYRSKENARIITDESRTKQTEINIAKLGTIGGRTEVYPVNIDIQLGCAEKSKDADGTDQDENYIDVSIHHKADDNPV